MAEKTWEDDFRWFFFTWYWFYWFPTKTQYKCTYLYYYFSAYIAGYRVLIRTKSFLLNGLVFWPVSTRRRSTVKRTDVWSRPSCIYTQIFSTKKSGFSPIKNTFQFILFIFVYLYSMQLFSADIKIFSEKILKKILPTKSWKNHSQKVAYLWQLEVFFLCSPGFRFDFFFIQLSLLRSLHNMHI